MDMDMMERDRVQMKLTLTKIYRHGRDLPGWSELYSFHDDEDRKYFDWLDGERKAGRVAVK